MSKKYISALREAAIGLPIGPFRGDFPSDFLRAAGEFAWHVWVLILWALAMLTYPVAIFVLAGVVVHSDAARENANRKADEEWFKGMNRGIDGDE
jgi:uncharacterized membrane protein